MWVASKWDFFRGGGHVCKAKTWNSFGGGVYSNLNV